MLDLLDKLFNEIVAKDCFNDVNPINVPKIALLRKDLHTLVQTIRQLDVDLRSKYLHF